MQRTRSNFAFLAALALAPAPLNAQAPCVDWRPGFARPFLNDTVHALAAHDDGSGPALYAGGQFGGTGSPPFWSRIVRWDGATWSGVGFGFNGNVLALHEFDAGLGPDLYAGGQFFPGGETPPYVARWNGASWLPLGSGLDGVAKAFATFDDGGGLDLYVGGQFHVAGGMPAQRIARWSGSSWSALGAGIGDGEVRALAVHDDGTGRALYAAGSFSTAGGAPAANIARWNGSAWSALSSGLDGTVHALASFGGVLVAGGDFSSAGGAPASRIAAWNGSAWSAFGSGADGSVRALRVDDDGFGSRLFAGGGFLAIDGVSAPAVARWDGATWSAAANGLRGVVIALAPFVDSDGHQLFAGGQLGLQEGATSANIVRWNGVRWSTVSQGLSAAPRAVEAFDDGSGTAMFVGGFFLDAGGLRVDRIAKWTGQGWAGLGGVALGTGGTVNALRTFDDGSGPALHVAGAFSTVGGSVSARNVARWDGSQWQALGAGVDGTVYDLQVLDDGGGPRLYASGVFPGFVTRWNGSAWVPMPGLAPIGTNPFGVVYALAAYDAGFGPEIYAAGYFGVSAGGATSIARWNGTQWVGIGSVTHDSWGAGDLSALEVYDDGSGPQLYTAGRFHSIGGVPVSSLARWNGTAWSSVPGYAFDGYYDVTYGLGLADLGDGQGTRLLALPNSAPLLAWNGAAWSTLAQPSGGSAYLDVRTLRGPGVTTPELWIACQAWELDGLGSNGVGVTSLCPETGRLVCFGDGSVVPCPCGNASPSASQAGCANSTGTGGALRASGAAQLAADTLAFEATGLPSSASALLFQGTTVIGQGSGAVFGDGLRCAGGTTRRLTVRAASAGTVRFGASEGDAATHVLGSVRSAGLRRAYQLWYRDAAAFCTPSTFDLTNAVEIVWEP